MAINIPLLAIALLICAIPAAGLVLLSLLSETSPNTGSFSIFSVVGAGLCLFGVLLAVGAVYQLLRMFELQRTPVETTGLLLECDANRRSGRGNRGSNYTYHVTYVFTPAGVNATPIHITEQVFRDFYDEKCRAEASERVTVEVQYAASDPHIAQIKGNSFVGYTLVFGFAAFAIFPLAFGSALFRHAARLSSLRLRSYSQ